MRITILSALLFLASLNLTAQADINQTVQEYINSARTKLDLGDYTGAIQDYNKAIELNPDDGFAYEMRGYAKDNLGDDKGAIQDYSRAIELDPETNSSAYYKRGLNEIDLGDYTGAINPIPSSLSLSLPLKMDTIIEASLSRN